MHGAQDTDTVDGGPGTNNVRGETVPSGGSIFYENNNLVGDASWGMDKVMIEWLSSSNQARIRINENFWDVRLANFTGASPSEATTVPTRRWSYPPFRKTVTLDGTTTRR